METPDDVFEKLKKLYKKNHSWNPTTPRYYLERDEYLDSVVPLCFFTIVGLPLFPYTLVGVCLVQRDDSIKMRPMVLLKRLHGFHVNRIHASERHAS